MEQKGLVSHRRDGKAYVYLPLIERESTSAKSPAALSNAYSTAPSTSTSSTPSNPALKAQELDELQAMIDAARKRHEGVSD